MRMKDRKIETAGDMAEVLVGALGFAESEGVLTYGLTYDDDASPTHDHGATFETEFAGRKFVVTVKEKKEE
jgi:hypothetical protein